MNKFLLIIVASILSLTYSYGYSADSLRVGDKSLLFSVNEGSIHPKSFDGGIGYGIFITPAIQLRLPIGLNYSSKTEEKPINTESDKFESSMGISFNPSIRFNIGYGRRIIVYTGLGLIFGYNNTVVEGVDYKNNSSRESEFLFGASASLGAEWFPWRSLGLALEYHPSLTFSSGNKIYESAGFEQEDKLPSRTNFNLAGSSILLVLSFYFY